jgi:hypothetical protein
VLFIRRRSHGRGFDVTSMRAINMKWSVLFKNLSISVQPHRPNLHIVHKASTAILVMHDTKNINMVSKHSNKILQWKYNIIFNIWTRGSICTSKIEESGHLKQFQSHFYQITAESKNWAFVSNIKKGAF